MCCKSCGVMAKMKISGLIWILFVLANKYNKAVVLLFYNFSVIVYVQLYAKYISRFEYVKPCLWLGDVY